MTWNIARGHLISLSKRKKVTYKKYGNKTLWKPIDSKRIIRKRSA